MEPMPGTPQALTASPLAAIAGIDDLRERTRALLEDPALEDFGFAHIENGGSLVGLAETLKVRYSDLNRFFNAPARAARYEAARVARDEWEKESIMADLRARRDLDIRDLYAEDGQLKPLSEWPLAAARFVEELTTDDLFDGQGKEREKVGETRKVKLMSRLKAMELSMKARAMLVERKEITIGLRLEDIMAASRDPLLDSATTRPPIDAEIVTPTPPPAGSGQAPPPPGALSGLHDSKSGPDLQKEA